MGRYMHLLYSKNDLIKAKSSTRSFSREETLERGHWKKDEEEDKGDPGLDSRHLLPEAGFCWTRRSNPTFPTEPGLCRFWMEMCQISYLISLLIETNTFQALCSLALDCSWRQRNTCRATERSKVTQRKVDECSPLPCLWPFLFCRYQPVLLVLLPCTCQDPGGQRPDQEGIQVRPRSQIKSCLTCARVM